MTIEHVSIIYTTIYEYYISSVNNDEQALFKQMKLKIQKTKDERVLKYQNIKNAICMYAFGTNNWCFRSFFVLAWWRAGLVRSIAITYGVWLMICNCDQYQHKQNGKKIFCT